MPSRILIVDDEINMQVALREVLKRQGHEISVASDGNQALELLEQDGACDLVITDVRMPEITGIELLKRIRNRWPETAVLVITAYGTVEDAVGAMKEGAADYLLKPFSSETVEEVVARLLARREAGELDLSDGDEGDEPGEERLTGRDASGRVDPIAVSPASRQVFDLAAEIADSTATVLLEGESGTGKEVVARFIHDQSDRRDGPFVAVNCAALPEGLLESELFGHEKGAFTGAVLARKGKFELANHGTLLLDEISEMPVALQAKLLRVLQERQVDPVGAQRPVSLDVRVIATTNRDIRSCAESGEFRKDLYYRLQVINIEVPPLRDRPEDIIPMSDYFVRRHARANRRPRKRLSEAMRCYLLEQTWPGNVRELENFLERAVLLCKGDEISPESILLHPPGSARRLTTPHQQETDSASPSEKSVPIHRLPVAAPAPVGGDAATGPRILAPGEIITLEEMERRLILQTLERVGGNRTRAADLLGVSVRTIRNKLNIYGLSKQPGVSAG